MPLTLAQMPRELLADITSHLSASVILDILFNCGNRLLYTKLKTGGVSRLSLNAPGVAPIHLKLILSLPLETLQLGHLGRSPDTEKELSRGCHKSLRRLEVWYSSLDALFDLDVLDPSSASHAHKTPRNAESGTVWQIGDTYPHLTSLFMPHCRTSDPEMVLRVLQSLPASLLELRLPDTAKIDIIPVLPPNLTTLHHLQTFPTAVHAPFLSNLTSLSLYLHPRLDLHTQETYLQAHLLPGLLVLPPHLTFLQLESPPNILKSLMPSLPTGLITFSATVLNLGITDVQHAFSAPIEMLQMIPPSVTKLSLAGIKVNQYASTVPSTTSSGPSQPRQAITLDAVKNFSFSGLLYCNGSRDTLQSQFLRDLIITVPFAESYSLGFSELEPEHLRLFKNPRLHTLDASFKAECFSKTLTGPSPLETALPTLRHLHLRSHLGLNCAEFPAFLSTLRTSSMISFTQLERVSSIIRMTGPFGITVENSELERATVLDTLSPTVNQASSDFSLLCSSLYLIETLVCLFRSKIDGSLLLRPRHANPGDAYSNLGDLEIHLRCKKPIAFPSRLTKLWISGEHLKDTPKDFCLPLVTKLSVVGKGFKGHQINAFPALLDLKLDCYGLLGGAGDGYPGLIECPPKLTSLRCTYGKWPFKTLAHSITSLEVLRIDLKRVAKLENLTTFLMLETEHPNPQVSELVKHLPGSITSIQFLLPRLLTPDMDQTLVNFWERFSSLKSLTLNVNPVHAVMDKLYQSIPPHVTSLSCTGLPRPNQKYECDLALLATRAGLGHGEINLLQDESLDQWAQRTKHLAYPRFESLANLKFVSSNMVAPFLPYLSPSTKELKMRLLDSIYGSESDVWPTKVTSLIFWNSLSLPNQRLCLPPYLQKLTIHGANASGCDIVLLSLPESLTCLTIPDWIINFEVTAWPPKLAELTVTFEGPHIATNLKSLPRSLTRLELQKGWILKSSEHIAAWPSGCLLPSS